MPHPLPPEPVVKVVIPALNEERALPKVLSAIPDFVAQVVVADNGSTDATAEVARTFGATVVNVPEPGYGRACMAGVAAAGACDVLVFLDGDASDHPEDMADILAPILSGEADMVIGARVGAGVAKGSLTLPQRWGNWLACTLMRWIWGSPYSDLGPFRAVRRDAYARLGMSAPTFGWTVEMQVRGLKAGLRGTEVPVRYRPRIGTSKISGTVRGVVLAGYYILGTIAWEALRPLPAPEPLPQRSPERLPDVA